MRELDDNEPGPSGSPSEMGRLENRCDGHGAGGLAMLASSFMIGKYRMGLIGWNAGLVATCLLPGLLLARLGVPEAVLAAVPFLPEGVALALLLRVGTGVLPGVFVGQFLLALLTHGDVTVALAMSSGGVLASALGLWGLKRAGIDVKLEGFRDLVLLLMASAVVIQPIRASLGQLVLWSGGHIPPSGMATSWFWEWERSVAGQWFLTPVLLRIWRNPRELFEHLSRYLVLVFTATTALAALAFMRLPLPPWIQEEIRWLFLPLIAICAARVGIDLALTQTLWAVLLMVAGVVAGVSSLDQGHLAGNLAHFNFLLATSSLCGCYVGVINRDLVHAQERANHTSEYRTRFLASMSHEIRTPLNGILGLVQILQRSGVRGSDRRHVEEIGRAGRSLLSLLNNILDLSKLEAGEFQPQSSEFLLDSVLEDTASTCLATLKSKGVDFWIACAPAVPLRCRGDAIRLQQVLVNLVSNATKFTSQGRVTVQVVALDGPGGLLRFDVVDTGMGMEKDVLEHIFKPYHQGDSSISNRFGGTGLGLTLSREIATKQGGDLRVRSEVGFGSHFTLVLPLAQEDEFSVPCGRLAVAIGEPHLQEAVELTARRCGWDIVPMAEADICISDAGGCGQIQLGDAEACSPGATVLPWPFTPYRLGAALLEFRHGTTAVLIPVVRPVLVGQKILLVEDEAVNRMVARQILEQSGAEVVEATDGLEALNVLESGDFHTVLMDLHMPAMGGLEATRRIRALLGNSLRILALTAGSTDQERLDCQLAGMDGFLTKPFDAEDLVRALAVKVVS